MRAKYRITQEYVQLSATSPIRVESLSVSDRVAPHDHDFYEICLVLGGAAIHVTPFGQKTIGEGEIIVVAPGEVHAFEKCRQLKVINVYYLAEWFFEDLRLLLDMEGMVPLFFDRVLFRRLSSLGIAQFSLNKKEGIQCRRELQDIEEEKQRNPSQLYLRSCFMKFLTKACRAYWRQVLDEKEREYYFRKEIWMFIYFVEEVIHRKIPFELNQLVKKVGLSRDHFSRIFREEVGMAPMEYYQVRRIHVACVQLLDPNVSLTEIAHRLLYADSAHFSRCFKKYRKVSPKEYRKQFL